MPSAVGPFSFSVALAREAITSKASSHDTGVSSPFLSHTPSFLRKSGVVRRSPPYMILERKYPLMQFSPRLTSASVSPWVATTLPSLTPTITPQPVPQKRHGAFDHLISSDPAPCTGCAAAGTAMPAAAAATAAACAFNNSRRESDMF